MVAYSACFRDEGTLQVYLPNLKFSCDVLGEEASWHDDPRVKRCIEGVKKSNFVYKPPRLAVGSDILQRLIPVASSDLCIERVFALVCWVFLLRASDECANLVVAVGAVLLMHSIHQLEIPLALWVTR